MCQFVVVGTVLRKCHAGADSLPGLLQADDSRGRSIGMSEYAAPGKEKEIRTVL